MSSRFFVGSFVASDRNLAGGALRLGGDVEWLRVKNLVSKLDASVVDSQFFPQKLPESSFNQLRNNHSINRFTVVVECLRPYWQREIFGQDRLEKLALGIAGL